MIGNNSCGVHSVMSGKTDDNIDELDILTYDGARMRVGATPPELLETRIREGGRVVRSTRAWRRSATGTGDAVRAQFPRIPRRVSGYNLDFLLPENGFNVARALVGSEGTCVTILEATARLVPSRRAGHSSSWDSRTSSSRPMRSTRSPRPDRSASRASTNCSSGIPARST